LEQVYGEAKTEAPLLQIGPPAPVIQIGPPAPVLQIGAPSAEFTAQNRLEQENQRLFNSAATAFNEVMQDGFDTSTYNVVKTQVATGKQALELLKEKASHLQGVE